jgi:hypothetical protein
MTGIEAAPGRDSSYAICGAKKRQTEGVCRRPAGWGTDHPGVGLCKLHGGNTRAHRERAQAEIVRREAARLGVPRDVDPAAALLELVYESAGNVEFYRDLVGQLSTTPTPPPPGADEDMPEGSRRPEGLYGPLRHQSGVPTGEAKPHVLVAMYDAERDRLKEYAATVVKVGLAERQVQVAELQAAVVARVVMALLDDPEFGLSREQREMGRRLAGRHLRQLSAAAVGGGDAA